LPQRWVRVVGLLKDFKVCPQCKTARYCAPCVRNRIGQLVGTRLRAADLYSRKVCAPA
jgi:hypothetical protein